MHYVTYLILSYLKFVSINKKLKFYINNHPIFFSFATNPFSKKIYVQIKKKNFVKGCSRQRSKPIGESKSKAKQWDVWDPLVQKQKVNPRVSNLPTELLEATSVPTLRALHADKLQQRIQTREVGRRSAERECQKFSYYYFKKLINFMNFVGIIIWVDCKGLQKKNVGEQAV